MEDSGYLGVSMAEEDIVNAYVNKADVVMGGLWGNMPIWQSAAKCSMPPTALAFPPKSDLPAWAR
jgi:hypothetical protein